MIYFPLIYYNSINHLAGLLSITSLMLGFYLLSYTERKHREILAGVAFSLALFSKYFTIAPLTIILLNYYGEREILKIKGKMLSINPKDALSIASLILPTLILLLMFTLMFQSFLEYTIYSQILGVGISFAGKLRLFLPTSLSKLHINLIPLYSAILVALYGLRKNEDIFSLISVIGLFGISFSLTRAVEVTTPGYYGLSIYPFLLISITKLRPHAGTGLARTLLTTLLIYALIYPSISWPPPFNIWETELEKQKNELRKEVEWPMHFIPKQDGNVLVEYWSSKRFEELMKGYDTLLEYGNISVISQGRYLLDDYYVERLVRVGALKKLPNEPWRVHTRRLFLELEPDTESSEIMGELKEGRYSLLISTPPSWLNIEKILDNIGNETRSQYHWVRVPNLEHFSRGGRHFTTLGFKNASQSSYFLGEMTQYYNEHFESICDKDEYATLMVKFYLSENGIDLNKTCDSGSALIYSYETNKGRLTVNDFTSFIIILTIVFVFYYTFDKFVRTNL